MGFKWVSDWEVDLNYTNTDNDGWSYGFTWSELLLNCKNNTSVIRKGHNITRRRKWIRTCIVVGEGNQAIFNADDFKQANDNNNNNNNIKMTAK